jgi:uncharacterized protein with HEPN domain
VRSSDYSTYVREIDSSCRAILDLVSQKSRTDFLTEKGAIREVRKHLRHIRKAARQIPESYRIGHPEVRWERLTAVQIVFFHEYYGIDVDAIWKIFKQVIEELEMDMKKMRLVKEAAR